MADPITISIAALDLIKQCVRIARLIKKTVETARSAKEALIELLRRAERFRGLLQLARSLADQARSSAQSGVLLEFNDGGCRKTLHEIVVFVNEVSRVSGDIRSGVWWITHKRQADSLVDRMAAHEYEINSLLLSIATITSLRTRDEVKELSQRVVSQMEIVTPFENISLDGGLPLATVKDSLQPHAVSNWLGETLQMDLDQEYIARRTQLSNAAYWGNWNVLFQILDDARTEYSESWINCIRLKPPAEADRVSGWTPLHQAVYMNAPVNVVERMIKLGAWRTIRTFWTDDGEFPFKNMTALEMAHFLGFSNLFDSLSPVIRHNIPAETLQILEDNFHDLIRGDLGDSVMRKRLCLPKLIVLTEMDIPQMWFPVKPFNDRSMRGYSCVLDQRELVVKSFGTHQSGQLQQYRISENGIISIEEAVIPGM